MIAHTNGKSLTKRLFSGVVGSPLSTIATEPAPIPGAVTPAVLKRRGRPRKYEIPEQARAAEAAALKAKRDAEKNAAEIRRVVDAGSEVDAGHILIPGSGWALTGQENLDKKSRRSATAGPAPSPDEVVASEDRLNEIQRKRDELLSLPIPSQLRWLLENASVDEIEEILHNSADPEQQSGGKRTAVADPEKLAEGTTKVTGKGPSRHTLRGPEQSRMDSCLRDMVDSVIEILEPPPVMLDTSPDADGPVEQIEHVEEPMLIARCTLCDKALDGLRRAWSEHLLEEHTIDVKRWFRRAKVPFSPGYYGLK